jgi:putative spermidine/putrescine transport system ATP-binding protein
MTTVEAATSGGEARARFGELRLEGVTRRFGQTTALDDFSLTIKGGEFVALLGPSGCGKTTALNCLAGLLPLSAGSIHLDGHRIDGMAPERRGFGMVFQNYALFPHLTVRRNVAFGLTMRRIARQEAADRVRQALDLVGLQEHIDKYPAQLSGGQQQRVAIARAVVIEPQLLLMDEPLSNLDAKLRLEMRNEIRARVQVVEYRGNDLAVEAVTEGERAIHIITGERLVPGDQVTLSVAPERVLVYDAEASP